MPEQIVQTVVAIPQEWISERIVDISVARGEYVTPLPVVEFSRHSVDLELDEVVMKQEKFTESPDHAGFNPDTMRVSKWHQEATFQGYVSHFSSSSCTSVAFVVTVGRQ